METLLKNKQGNPPVKDWNPRPPVHRTGALPPDQLALADQRQFEPAPALIDFRHQDIQYTQNDDTMAEHCKDQIPGIKLIQRDLIKSNKYIIYNRSPI